MRALTPALSPDRHLFDPTPRAPAAASLESVPREGVGSNVGEDPAFRPRSSVLLLKHDFPVHPSSDESTNFPLTRRDPRAPPGAQMGVIVSNGRAPRNQAAGSRVDGTPDILNGPPAEDPVEVDLAFRNLGRGGIPVLHYVPAPDELPEQTELGSKIAGRSIRGKTLDTPTSGSW
jgi:hypothetical protein